MNRQETIDALLQARDLYNKQIDVLTGILEEKKDSLQRLERILKSLKEEQ